MITWSHFLLLVSGGGEGKLKKKPFGWTRVKNDSDFCFGFGGGRNCSREQENRFESTNKVTEYAKLYTKILDADDISL